MLCVKVLGPLEVIRDGVPITPSAPKLQRVFSLLAVSANHIVRTEQLIEEQLAVMSLAVVDVEIEGAVRGEQLTRTSQTRGQERQVIGERILVAQRVK